MKLYWGPHTCAIGIHILLEEAGATYDTEQLDVSGGATEEPAFLAINPKGKVPTLVRDDGAVLTEFGAIATWIGRAFPDAGLLASDIDGDARMVEVMEYVEGTVHGQGFARMLKPEKFEPQDVVHTKIGIGQSAVKAQGKTMVERAFDIIDKQLAGRRFVTGDQFTIADAALFYVERWTPQAGITLPGNVKTHYETMLARPAVQKVRKLWGEA